MSGLLGLCLRNVPSSLTKERLVSVFEEVGDHQVEGYKDCGINAAPGGKYPTGYARVLIDRPIQVKVAVRAAMAKLEGYVLDGHTLQTTDDR